MDDLIVGAGLVLVIEGLVWAVAPGTAAALLARAAVTPEHVMRTGGAVAVAAGCALVWMIRG